MRQQNVGFESIVKKTGRHTVSKLCPTTFSMVFLLLEICDLIESGIQCLYPTNIIYKLRQMRKLPH